MGSRTKTQPPPIPDRHRSLVRIDTEPEPPRAVRSVLVGRDKQLATLEDIVSRAIDFQAPQLVTIVGNQGTGKSRLINELITKVTAQQVRVFHGAPVRDTMGKPQPLSALVTLLRDRFELTPNPDDVTKLRFIHEIKSVMKSEHIAEIQYFLGNLVGFDFLPTPFLSAVAENPKQHAELTRTALRRFIEADAAQSPLVLVLDD